MRPSPLRPRTLGLLLLAGIALVAASCSSEASTRSGGAEDGPTTTAAPVTTAATIPDGITLRVGDQLDYLTTVLEISGEDQDLPYTLEYANFVGGPPMLQAFQGGALDAGFTASTPLIFAQAGDQDIAAIAGWAPEKGLGGLITTDDSIEDWADLKGKRVAYQRGTSAEAAVLTGLDEAGLTPDDITTVDVPIIQVSSAIKGGSADAGVSTEPLISQFVADTPGGRVALAANDLTDRAAFLIAARDALEDEGTSAALADYASRLVRAFTWLGQHRQALADSVFAKQYGLSPERALELAESTGATTFFELPGPIGGPQQQLADRFFTAGQIPAELDTAQEFDNRFNELIQKEFTAADDTGADDEGATDAGATDAGAAG